MGKSFDNFAAIQRWASLRIAAIYMFAAGLWYFLTDMILRHFSDGTLEIAHLQAVKRSMFILASAALIHWLVRRNMNALRREEQKAHAQLTFLQELIDTIPSPIFYKDRDGRYVGCNLAFESYLGMRKNDLVGKTVYDIAPKDLADKYFEMDEALFTNPGVQVYESSVVYSDGSRHDVLFNKATFSGTDCSTGGLVGVILDITERKRAEEALVAAEDKFRSLVEQSLTGIYIIQDEKFVYANPKMAEIFGYTQAELTSGISHLDLTSEKDRALAATNVNRRVAGEIQSIQYEFQGLRKDGSIVEIEVYGTSIEYNGRPAIIGTLLDVTARRQAEEALKDSEERFHQIFTQNWDAVILFRLDNFAIIDANPAAMDLYRLSHEEIINVFPASLIDPNDFRKLIDMVPHDDRSRSFQLDKAVAIRGDGTKMIVSLRAKVVRLRDEYVVYCSARDITKRVRMEEEIKDTQAKLIHTNKMTSLGMLASGIAHEVNNPNSYINVNASMLADVWRDASPILHRYYEENGDFSLGGLPFSEMDLLAPRLIAAITEGSRQINDIVNNMRDFIKSGKGCLDDKVDVNRVIQDATSILWHHIHRHTDNFRLSLQEDIPPARGNSRQIEQAMINLIMNALQALPDKRAAVFTESSFDSESGRIKLTVRDEGKGIDVEARERLKEPFFTTRIEDGGTGLGLYISDTIIKEHGGSLEIESFPGKGTTATIILAALDIASFECSAPRGD